ncbi:kunitz trypsin inhibitor 5 [Lactuca sativa]|uniref:kunitz trypsin inhibitor 5 n=1 Tax=Lactuca sativa TaxID=4236 RepID=UPI000CB8C229|nr:kunitz trypsin inhibitor 5 [Lactuca sativa]
MKKPLFIFILMCTLSLLSGQALQVPVRDTDRNFLLAGTSYYILPAIRGRGGGVTLATGRDQPCPNDVAQENNEVSKGLPLNFAPANTSKDGIIRQSTDLNVKFSGKATTCIDTAVWRVEDDLDIGLRIVSSHAILGQPGRETIRNWFKIEKYENAYKLVYCPTVCNDCRPYCADIGSTIAKNGRRILVLNNVPLKVMFKKA